MINFIWKYEAKGEVTYLPVYSEVDCYLLDVVECLCKMLDKGSIEFSVKGVIHGLLLLEESFVFPDELLEKVVELVV